MILRNKRNPYKADRCQRQIPAPNPHLQAKALTSDQLPHSVPTWDASTRPPPLTADTQGAGPGSETTQV